MHLYFVGFEKKMYLCKIKWKQLDGSRQTRTYGSGLMINGSRIFSHNGL